MRNVLHQLGRYKKDTFLCIGMTALEVIMEILLPFITAIIIDEGLQASSMPTVYRYGMLMIIMAFVGLFFGATAGKFAASASSGLSGNLLEGRIYHDSLVLGAKADGPYVACAAEAVAKTPVVTISASRASETRAGGWELPLYSRWATCSLS